MKYKKVPKFLQSILWSYDINSLDRERDKELIITQVLNYGGWKEVRWLFKNYPEWQIKRIMKKPSRGVWFNKVLNFWTTFYNIKLEKNTYEDAIFEPNKIKEKYLKK